MNRVEIGEKDELTQYIWNRDEKGTLIVLDEASLLPVRVEAPKPEPEWRRQLSRPESDFQVKAIPNLRREGGPMEVQLIPGKNSPEMEGVNYYLRWEHAGTNRDRPIPKPWPEPTMLRVYKIAE